MHRDLNRLLMTANKRMTCSDTNIQGPEQNSYDSKHNETSCSDKIVQGI